MRVFLHTGIGRGSSCQLLAGFLMNNSLENVFTVGDCPVTKHNHRSPNIDRILIHLNQRMGYRLNCLWFLCVSNGECNEAVSGLTSTLLGHKQLPACYQPIVYGRDDRFSSSGFSYRRNLKGIE